MRRIKLADGLKNETKAKLESLLNTAMKKKAKSKQHLVSDDEESAGSNEETYLNESADVDIHREEDLSVENKSYILDKFLNDSSHEQDPVEQPTKRPIPKPRKNKVKSPSTETYTVSPIKHITNKNEQENIELDRIETASNRTFDIDKKSPSNTKSYESEEISYEKETKVKPRRRKNAKKTETVMSVYNYSKIINVVIHRSDRLLLDSFVVHPVVKVHLVNWETGEYVKKSDKSRSIIFYYENKDIDYIGPVMTQAYNLQENRSLHPNWEESILINEDFNYLTNNHNVLIFFEIMDFLSTAVIKQENQRGQLGWRKIAWAFLKPTSPTYSNLNKTVRLQLYYPSTTKKNISPEKSDIFNWWLKKKFRKYPSTLYVSINNVQSPTTAVETLRSRGPNEIETGKEDLNLDVPKTTNLDSSLHSESDVVDEKEMVVWDRKENQICKLPNKCVYKINGYEEGCFVMSFSHSGLYLACCIVSDSVYLIIIYSILENEELAKLEAHQGLVYRIIWSSDDKLLLTASADCTVCLWNMKSYKFAQMLPHPSFVYSCDVHNNTIATGCFDKFIRIWKFDSEIEYELNEELGGHSGYITSICFNKNGTLLYSADSIGSINVWKYVEEQWSLRREIKVLDLKDTVINQILLHRKERRLLVNSRDSKIRLIDIKTGYVLQTYHGAFNNREEPDTQIYEDPYQPPKTTQNTNRKHKTMRSLRNKLWCDSKFNILVKLEELRHWNARTYKNTTPVPNLAFRVNVTCCFSPCGYYILCGSENGEIYAWDAETGKIEHIYNPYNLQLEIHCVQYHPKDNYFAVSHYGNNLPILLYKYDKESDDKTSARHSAEQGLSCSSKVKSNYNKNDALSFREILQKMDHLISPK